MAKHAAAGGREVLRDLDARNMAREAQDEITSHVTSGGSLTGDTVYTILIGLYCAGRDSLADTRP